MVILIIIDSILIIIPIRNIIAIMTSILMRVIIMVIMTRMIRIIRLVRMLRTQLRVQYH